ncbi:hypothetical protein ACLOJK_020907 [Asimina triloba]
MAVVTASATETAAASPVEQEMSEDLDLKVRKYLRGEGADLKVLRDKKLKGELAVREELYGKSAKAAAKAEKWRATTVTCGLSGAFSHFSEILELEVFVLREWINCQCRLRMSGVVCDLDLAKE